MVQVDTALGDLDGNGEITVRDYILMDKRLRLGGPLSPEEKDIFDLNRDGVVDDRDATLMYWRTNPVGDMDGDLELTENDIDILEELIEEYDTMAQWEKPEDITRFDLNKDGEISVYDLHVLRQKYEYMYAMGRH